MCVRGSMRLHGPTSVCGLQAVFSVPNIAWFSRHRLPVGQYLMPHILFSALLVFYINTSLYQISFFEVINASQAGIYYKDETVTELQRSVHSLLNQASRARLPRAPEHPTSESGRVQEQQQQQQHKRIGKSARRATEGSAHSQGYQK